MCTGVSPKRIATRNFGFVLFRFAFFLRAVSRNNAKPSRFISGLLGTFYLVSTDNTTVKQPLLLLP